MVPATSPLRTAAVNSYNNLWIALAQNDAQVDGVGLSRATAKLVTDYTVQSGKLKGFRAGFAVFYVQRDRAGFYTGDVVPNPDGTCSVIPVAGNGFQAGLDPLSAFQAVFTADLNVSSAGQLTFNVFSDDGFVLAIGPQGTNQPTRISGPRVATVRSLALSLRISSIGNATRSCGSSKRCFERGSSRATSRSAETGTQTGSAMTCCVVRSLRGSR